MWVCPLVTFRVTPYTPSYTPSGSYTFRLEGSGGEALSFGRIRVTGTRPIPKPAEIPHPLSAQLGDAIRLLGYGVNRTTLRPGETLVLDFYGEALRLIEESHTVFTHLVGTAWNPATRGPVWAQHDQEPLGGAYPTHLWVPGRPLRDRYELMLPPGTPPGEYVLEAGMYRRTTGERLPVSGEGADPAARRIVLGTIVVR